MADYPKDSAGRPLYAPIVYKKVKLICTDPQKPGYMAQVVDAETGQPITNFDSLDVHIDVRSVPTAIMHVVAPEADIEVNAEVRPKFFDCAMRGCQNAASPSNRVDGSFLPELPPFAKYVSNVDLAYNRLADRVTLYLCDKCMQKIQRGIN